jgi:methionyl-tRNA formyltransferase
MELNMADPKVVFFGSGPVAAKSLELLQNNFDIEAVITKPKPAHHKGSFPVLDICKAKNIPYLTCSNRKELSSLISARKFESKIGVLIDFGIIVTQDVIDAFSIGIVNSHFSILPDLRGADPITFAILSGQKTTGVSLMLLVEKMDEGPLIAYGEYELPENITTPVLTQHLIQFSDQLLSIELPKYIADQHSSPQSITGRKISYSRKLTKQDGLIDWDKPAEVIERQIRAFLQWPKSYTKLSDIEVVITEAEITESQGQPGKYTIIDKQLIIYCGHDSIRVKKLKPSGKKEMSAEAFINGHKDILLSN